MTGGKNRKSTPSRILFIIFWILLLSVLPFVIFRPENQTETVQKSQKRFTFMTSTPLTEDDQHDLAYWEKAGTPQLFAKPDSRFGFSAFLTPEMNHAKPVVSHEEQLPALPDIFTPGKITVSEKRDLQDLLPQMKIPLIRIAPEKQVLLLEAPVFLLEDGTVLPIAGFKQPESSVKNLQPTLLQVVKRSPDSPPEISVLRSCGDDQLDAAAMRALFFPAAVNQKIKGTIRVEWKDGGIK